MTRKTQEYIHELSLEEIIKKLSLEMQNKMY